MQFVEFLLQNICEIIIINLFLLFSFNIKFNKKSVLYLIINSALYLILIKIFVFDIKLQLFYLLLTYIILKFSFKYINVVCFIFIIFSYFYLFITALPFYLFFGCFYQNYMLCLFIIRLFELILLIKNKNKLNKLYKIIINNWNVPKIKGTNRIKAITLRNITVIFMNIVFLIIFVWLSFMK